MAIILSILTAVYLCLNTIISIARMYSKIVLEINNNKKYIELELYHKSQEL